MISKLENTMTNTQVASVYNYNDLSLQQLLSTFFKKINETVEGTNNSLEFLKWLKEEGLEEETQKEIQKLYDDGRLGELVNKQLFGSLNGKIDEKQNNLSLLNNEYNSIITNDMKGYSYEQLNNDIETFKVKYQKYLSVKTIGISVLGRDIKCLVLGNQKPKHKLLVFSGHHAREQHMCNVIMRQIEMYCENMDRIFNDETMKAIFEDSAIYFIPSINPDGLELCRIGLESIPVGMEGLRTKVKQAIEHTVRNTAEVGREFTQAEYDEIITQFGSKENYSFRNKDCHIWKANLNGVDLHYNCWTEDTNGPFVKTWANQQKWPTTFASQDFIGEVGFGEPENQALKGLMDSENLKTYTISYHGKGPTNFWNYSLNGSQVRRNYKIVNDISNISNTPYNNKSNGNVGFSGYMYSQQGGNTLTFSCINETGWGNEVINPDNNYVDTNSPLTVCPLDNWQLPYIWRAQRFIPLYMLAVYVRRQDLKQRDVLLTSYELDPSKAYTTDDITYSQTNSGIDGVITNKRTGIIEQWGVSVLTFTNTNYVSQTIKLKKPFTTRNFGGFANCYTTSEAIKNKLIDIKIDRQSLDEFVLSVKCESQLNTTIPINWFIRGY